jgi:hypothetical protein
MFRNICGSRNSAVHPTATQPANAELTAGAEPNSQEELGQATPLSSRQAQAVAVATVLGSISGPGRAVDWGSRAVPQAVGNPENLPVAEELANRVPLPER